MSFSNLLRSTMQRTLERTTLSEPHIFFALFLPASSWKKRFYAQCNTEFCTWIAQLFECILYATWRKNVQKYAMRTRECDQHVQFSIVHCSPPQYFKVPPSRIKNNAVHAKYHSIRYPLGKKVTYCYLALIKPFIALVRVGDSQTPIIWRFKFNAKSFIKWISVYADRQQLNMRIILFTFQPCYLIENWKNML